MSPIGSQNKVLTGVRRHPVLARRDLTGLDGSLDCPVRNSDVPSWDPKGPNLTHQTLIPDGVWQRATWNAGARPPPLWLARPGMESPRANKSRTPMLASGWSVADNAKPAPTIHFYRRPHLYWLVVALGSMSWPVHSYVAVRSMMLDQQLWLNQKSQALILGVY